MSPWPEDANFYFARAGFVLFCFVLIALKNSSRPRELTGIWRKGLNILKENLGIGYLAFISAVKRVQTL